MTFKDVFKSSFLDNLMSVSILDIVISLLLAFGIGLFIFFVYKSTYKGVMYSTGFGVTLVAITLITTVVILAVTSNVVLSLGMVGALSIVRFRTAIKEPLDIAFLFWSITAGIVLAAGLIPLALIGSAFIGIVLLLFVNKKGSRIPYLLVLRCNEANVGDEALGFIKNATKKMIVKSKSVSAAGTELNVEVQLKDEDAGFVTGLLDMPGIESATLVSYNGDYMG